MHYILIISMLSYPQPFPTLDDCLAMQAAYQQAGNKTSYCVPRSHESIQRAEHPFPMVTAEERARDAGVRVKDSAEAFEQGWKEEMQKPEPVVTMGQDI
jgi:hypothetical protein